MTTATPEMLEQILAAARAEADAASSELRDLADHSVAPDVPCVIRLFLTVMRAQGVRLGLIEQQLHRCVALAESQNEQVKRSLAQTERALSQTETALAAAAQFRAPPTPARRRVAKPDVPLGQDAQVLYAAFGQQLAARVTQPSTTTRVRIEFNDPRTGELVQRNVHRYKLRLR